MLERIRLEKDVARKFVVEFAPQYAELLRDFQCQGKWLRLPDELLTHRENLKINNYVELYNDERRLYNCLSVGSFGEEGLKEINAEMAQMSHERQVDLFHDLVQELSQLDIDVGQGVSGARGQALPFASSIPEHSIGSRGKSTTHTLVRSRS